MASETFTASPSVTVSKKKRSSEKFKESYNKSASKSASKKARPSEKALVPVPTLPEPQFTYQGKLFENEDKIADEAENRYYANQWDEFLEKNPEAVYASEDIPVGKDYRGRTVTQSPSGDRKDYYKDILDFDGTPRSRIRAGSHQSVGWKRESRKKKGTWTMPKSKSKIIVDEDEAIIDADYEDVRNSPQFRKAQAKDARDLGLPKRSMKPVSSQKENPPDMKAISERKRSTVSEINDIAKSSIKRKPSLVKSRDLIDESFDEVVKVGKGVAGIGKTVAKAGIAGIGAGFGALDSGVKAFGESAIAKNLRNQAEADYRHMRSHGFRAAESIKGTAGNKREISAASLVTQKGRSRKSSSSSSGSSSSSSRESIHGFSARYIKEHRGHISLQWFYKLQPVEFSDVKGYLSNNEINHLRKAANEVFKGHINIGSLSVGSISVGSLSGSSSSSKDSVPTLTQKSGYGLAKGTKTATIGGLIKKRNHSVSQDTDYGNYGYDNYGYEPAGTVARVNRNAGSLVTTKTRAGGLNTLKTHSDIVGSTKTATPEGLFSSNKGGVKAQTNEISTSGINKPTSGGVQAQTNEASPSRLFGKKRGGIRAKKRPATPSKLLSKAGDADRTVTAGVIRRSGEIGTTGSENGIVSKSKPVTTGTIVTKKRTGGASA